MGLYQGDSLSPLLFSLCAAPVSDSLREICGYCSEHQSGPLTHLAFVDDIKCYEESEAGIGVAVGKAKSVLGAIRMPLGMV